MRLSRGIVNQTQVQVKVNDELKVKLVEDWASVTQKDMLVRLPRDPTVSIVLQVGGAPFCLDFAWEK